MENVFYKELARLSHQLLLKIGSTCIILVYDQFSSIVRCKMRSTISSFLTSDFIKHCRNEYYADFHGVLIYSEQLVVITIVSDTFSKRCCQNNITLISVPIFVRLRGSERRLCTTPRNFCTILKTTEKHLER